MKKLLTALVLGMILAVSICASAALASEGRRITNYAIDISVNVDGSADIRETVVYSLEGDYQEIAYSIRSARPSDLKVYVDGVESSEVGELGDTKNTFVVSEGDRGSEVRIYSPGTGGMRAVEYRYKTSNFAERYNDCGRIAYALEVLKGQPGLDSAVVKIVLPGAGGDMLRTFGHGVLEEEGARISSDRTAITLGPVEIVPGERAEVLILFPLELLPDAPTVDDSIYQSTVEYEESIIAARSEEYGRTLRISIILLVAYAACAAAVVVAYARKYGLRGKIKSSGGDDAVDRCPAAYAELVLGGSVGTGAVAGTIIELVRAGALVVEPGDEESGGEITFAPIGTGIEAGSGSAKKLYTWYFEGGARRRISELTAGDNLEAARKYTADMNDYNRTVMDEAVSDGLFYKNDTQQVLGAAFIVLAGIVLGMMMCLKAMIAPALLTAALLVAGVVIMARVRKLTDAGESLYNALVEYASSGSPRPDGSRISIDAAIEFIGDNTEYDEDSLAVGFGGNYYPGMYRDLAGIYKLVDDVQLSNNQAVSPRNKGETKDDDSKPGKRWRRN